MGNELIEIANDIEEPKGERIWFSIFGVLGLYTVILVFSDIVLRRIVSLETLTAKPYLYTINLFVILMIYFFIIVFILRIPYDNISILKSLKEKNLSKYKALPIILGLGIVVGFVFLVFLLFSSFIASMITEGELVLDFRFLWTTSGFSNFLYKALIPGIWEEVAFRGIVLVLLMKKYSKKISLIINSVLFGFYHIVNLINLWGATNPYAILINVAFQVVYATAAGFVFAYLFMKTESLIPSILSHYLLDAFGPFVQAIAFYGGYSLTELVIVRTSQTIIGIGYIPSFVNILIIYLIYRMWKKEPFFADIKISDEKQGPAKTETSI
jgi:membrane protease YdiL (CAAX protease family)